MSNKSCFKLPIKKITNSFEETEVLAENFAKIVKPSQLVAFFADLGAGKTAFIKGFAKRFNVKEQVFSPSFSIVNEYFYEKNKKLIHYDLYRMLEDEQELYNTGYFDYLKDKNAIILVEWAEKILKFLPSSYFKVEINFLEEDSREIKIDWMSENENFSD